MPCCDLRERTSSGKSSVRFVGICQKEQVPSFDQRQIPIQLDDHLIIKLEFDNICPPYQNDLTNPNYQTFINTYEKLSCEELEEIFNVSIRQIKESVLRFAPCIGCRTSIDSFLKSLIEYRYPALDPFVLNEKNCLTMTSTLRSNGNLIYYLFYIYGGQFDLFLESIPKSRKNRRCPNHSLEKSRSIKDWEIVWDLMNKECRDEVTLVETDGLLDVLENYLHKHKFCSECKLRVLEAYDLLLDEHERKIYERKGFCPSLYDGLRSCSNNKHIHIELKRNFLRNLINRAESEIQGNRRERHAKSFDVAQEEILTCLGIYLFERFDKLNRMMKSEEQAWQYLFYITIDCFRMNFQRFIDRQRNFNEFRLVDEQLNFSKKKRSKRKSRPAGKSTNLLVETKDECLLTCLRCSSTRTDPGYSSGHEDVFPSELSDFSIITNDKTVESSDDNRKSKLKLQLSNQYPFFTMDFKSIWEENLSMNSIEKRSFISDEDLHRFFTLNNQIELKRTQLRDKFKSNFHAWQQQTICRRIVQI